MNVSVIGAGTMGSALTRKMLSSGNEVRVWNRTASSAEPLAEHGAQLAGSPAEAAAGADVVLSSLKDDAAVRATVLALADDLSPRAVLCDTSTISPGLADELASAFRELGKGFVHAPVLGSKRQIAEGTLLVFASGTEESVLALDPVFRLLARRVWRFDDPRQAASLKLACNTMIATMICALSQSLTFGAKLGVDPSLFLDVIAESNLASPMYASKGLQILERNWAANFVVENLIKDIRLAVEAGAEAGVQMPVLALVGQLFETASASGFAQEDYSAVSKVFEDLAGVSLSSCRT